VRQPIAYLLARRLFAAYSAALLGLVIGAIMVPQVIAAREVARRAICTNIVRQHSGSHPDVVVLAQGKIERVASCWCCGSKPWRRLEFIEEKEGELCATEQARNNGFAVIHEALDRLRQYNLDRRESERIWLEAARQAAVDSRADKRR
jgi:hypothetical protein